jgi:Ca2+-binding EF-hand superfamily protein
MKEAYTLFFNNPDEEIGMCEFLNTLKDDKYVSLRVLKKFIEKIDVDKSLNISSKEFFDFMIEKLNLKTLGKPMTSEYVEH